MKRALGQHLCFNYRRSLQVAGVLRGCARTQLREAECNRTPSYSSGTGSAPHAGVSNNVRSKRHVFRRWPEPRENSDRSKCLRQKHLSQTDCAHSVYGAHWLLRAGQISHHRYSDSHSDSDHVERQHLPQHEQVLAGHATGTSNVLRDGRTISSRSFRTIQIRDVN